MQQDFKYSFYLPKSLWHVTIVDETQIGYGAMMELKEVTTVDYNNLQYIGDYGFYGDSKLVNVNSTKTLPDTQINLRTITHLGRFAFADCTSIVSLTIPQNLDDIGRFAFAFDDSLSHIVFENKKISEFMFYFDYGLKDLIIPDNIEEIGYGAFGRTIGLETLTVPFIGKHKYIEDSKESLFGWIFGELYEARNDNEYEFAELNRALARYLGNGANMAKVKLALHEANPASYPIVDNTLEVTDDDANNYLMGMLNDYIAYGLVRTYQTYDKEHYYDFYIPKSLGIVTISNETKIIGFGAFYNVQIANIFFTGVEEIRDYVGDDKFSIYIIIHCLF